MLYETELLPTHPINSHTLFINFSMEEVLMVRVCRKKHFVCWPQKPVSLVVGILCLVLFGLQPVALAQPKPRFNINEAGIADIQQAIKRGHLTCRGVVQASIDRAAAYNGACTQLITADGAPIPLTTGAVRAGAAVQFPTQTVAAPSLLPNLDQSVGLPLDLGRMETTIADPSVKQQRGMRVGIPNAGQLNAIETLNLRGERSVACKADCDVPPSSPLPSHCPLTCEAFRQQPDAFSEILPRLMPDIFSTTTSSGALQFAVPGFDVTSYAYLLALSRRQAPLAANLKAFI